MNTNNINYLYGATVQGVQEYIMRRSKLSEICEADSNVSVIRTKLIEELLKDIDKNNYKTIENGAGKIKILFSCKNDCERITLNFPKLAMKFAPGITISQAVVEIKGENITSDDINKLDSVIKNQRNRPHRPLNIGLMGIARQSATSMPYYPNQAKNVDEQFLRFFPDNVSNRITKDFSKIKGCENWIAIVHIDGNNLTQILKHIASKDPKGLRDFDNIMFEVMTKSSIKAFHSIEKSLDLKYDIPLRPIAMGGDDLTIVCRADLAIEYASAFIETFEVETARLFKNKDYGVSFLTACVGVAFTKAKFPYYFGYQLAEELCKYAKKSVKKINSQYPPSSIMLHKIQDSFAINYDSIINRELTISKTENFINGPYFINHKNGTFNSCNIHIKNFKEIEKQQYWTVDELLSITNDLSFNNSVKNGLREWITLKLRNDSSAPQKIKRLEQIATSNEINLITKLTTKSCRNSYATHDLLSYRSIIKNYKNE